MSDEGGNLEQSRSSFLNPNPLTEVSLALLSQLPHRPTLFESIIIYKVFHYLSTYNKSIRISHQPYNYIQVGNKCGKYKGHTNDGFYPFVFCHGFGFLNFANRVR
jgi:hypothetical protein